MSYIIVNQDTRMPPYWSVPWYFRNKVTGDWQAVGGWERQAKYATKYEDRQDAESVIAFRNMDAEVVHLH